MNCNLWSVLFLVLLSPKIYSQSVGISDDNSDPNNRAMLDVKSATKGMLLPRMTTVQRDAFGALLSNAETGMLVFDTDDNTFYFWQGSNWVDLEAQSLPTLADLDGDTRIESERNTDEDKLRLSTAGNDVMIVDHDGEVGIGTDNPRGKLDVDGTGDVYLVDDPQTGTDQNIFLPGSAYLAPHDAGDISYLRAQRPDESGSTSLYIQTTDENTAVDAMRITSEGKVGINNLTPFHELDVNGNAIVRQKLIVSNGVIQQGGVFPQSSDVLGLYQRSLDKGINLVTNDNPINFYVNLSQSQPILTVNNDGKVGVKTPSPDQELDVNGNAEIRGKLFMDAGVIQQGDGDLISPNDLGLYQTDANRPVRVVTDAGDVGFYTDGGTGTTPVMILKADGKLGLGVADPAYHLDVDGAINTTGFRMATGADAGFVLVTDLNGDATWQKADNVPTGTVITKRNSGAMEGFSLIGQKTETFDNITDQDKWNPIGTPGPSARYAHTATWTDSLMIVWGGLDGGFLNSGSRYDTISDAWAATTTVDAPSARFGHAAGWVSPYFVVWGGQGNSGVLDDGMRYHPKTDTWSTVSTVGALTARSQHTTVQSDTEIIIWGGFDGVTYLNDGGRYNPNNDNWFALNSTNSPTGRIGHTAVWTGESMIVWGGYSPITDMVGDGAYYLFNNNSWNDVTTSGAPVPRRDHAAVWTGREMVIWGGTTGTGLTNTGARYNPTTDTWTEMSITNAPDPRKEHVMIWTGAEVIVFGGRGDTDDITFNDGKRYNPDSDDWIDMTPDGIPTSRRMATGVWTGAELLVWGGIGGSAAPLRDDGGRYVTFSVGDPVMQTFYFFEKQ